MLLNLLISVPPPIPDHFAHFRPSWKSHSSCSSSTFFTILRTIIIWFILLNFASSHRVDVVHPVHFAHPSPFFCPPTLLVHVYFHPLSADYPTTTRCRNLTLHGTNLMVYNWRRSNSCTSQIHKSGAFYRNSCNTRVPIMRATYVWYEVLWTSAQNPSFENLNIGSAEEVYCALITIFVGIWKFCEWKIICHTFCREEST